MKPVSTDSAPAAVGPYSQAIDVDGFLFVSGQIPLDPKSGIMVEGDIAAQTERVMQNLIAILAEAGLTLSDVVKAQVYLIDMGDFAAVNQVYAKFFGDHRPARACVAVSGLPKGAHVEIDVVARR